MLWLWMGLLLSLSVTMPQTNFGLFLEPLLIVAEIQGYVAAAQDVLPLNSRGASVGSIRDKSCLLDFGLPNHIQLDKEHDQQLDYEPLVEGNQARPVTILEPHTQEFCLGQAHTQDFSNQ